MEITDFLSLKDIGNAVKYLARAAPTTGKCPCCGGGSSASSESSSSGCTTWYEITSNVYVLFKNQYGGSFGSLLAGSNVTRGRLDRSDMSGIVQVPAISVSSFRVETTTFEYDIVGSVHGGPAQGDHSIADHKFYVQTDVDLCDKTIVLTENIYICAELLYNIQVSSSLEDCNGEISDLGECELTWSIDTCYVGWADLDKMIAADTVKICSPAVSCVKWPDVYHITQEGPEWVPYDEGGYVQLDKLPIDLSGPVTINLEAYYYSICEIPYDVTTEVYLLLGEQESQVLLGTKNTTGTMDHLLVWSDITSFNQRICSGQVERVEFEVTGDKFFTPVPHSIVPDAGVNLQIDRHDIGIELYDAKQICDKTVKFTERIYISANIDAYTDTTVYYTDCIGNREAYSFCTTFDTFVTIRTTWLTQRDGLYYYTMEYCTNGTPSDSTFVKITVAGSDVGLVHTESTVDVPIPLVYCGMQAISLDAEYEVNSSACESSSSSCAEKVEAVAVIYVNTKESPVKLAEIESPDSFVGFISAGTELSIPEFTSEAGCPYYITKVEIVTGESMFRSTLSTGPTDCKVQAHKIVAKDDIYDCTPIRVEERIYVNFKFELNIDATSQIIGCDSSSYSIGSCQDTIELDSLNYYPSNQTADITSCSLPEPECDIQEGFSVDCIFDDERTGLDPSYPNITIPFEIKDRYYYYVIILSYYSKCEATVNVNVVFKYDEMVIYSTEISDTYEIDEGNSIAMTLPEITVPGSAERHFTVFDIEAQEEVYAAWTDPTWGTLGPQSKMPEQNMVVTISNPCTLDIHITETIVLQ